MKKNSIKILLLGGCSTLLFTGCQNGDVTDATTQSSSNESNFEQPSHSLECDSEVNKNFLLETIQNDYPNQQAIELKNVITITSTHNSISCQAKLFTETGQVKRIKYNLNALDNGELEVEYEIESPVVQIQQTFSEGEWNRYQNQILEEQQRRERERERYERELKKMELDMKVLDYEMRTDRY